MSAPQNNHDLRSFVRAEVSILRIGLGRLQGGSQALAVMHGSSYVGQGDRLLNGLASVINENFAQA